MASVFGAPYTCVDNCDVVQLFDVAGDTEVSMDAMSHVASMTKQRLNRMPIQYIVGDWDFHNISVKLQPPVFIPRPETEVCFFFVCLHVAMSLKAGHIYDTTVVG